MSDLLSTGASALLSFQRAMTTTSHNVANANTPGYSRQRVELNSRGANFAGFGFIGAGVEVTTIRRMVNGFLTGRLDQSAAEMGRLTALSGLSSRVNRLMTASSTSISGPLSGYFDSVEGVSVDPRSSAAREGMLQSAQNLAARFQTQQRQLNELETETNQQISAEVGEINQLSTQIARLNDEIVRLQASGQPPNDLLDQRDLAIQTLSGKIGVTTTDQGDGALNVFTTGGLNLVLGKTTQTITVASDPLRPERLQLSLSSPSGPIRLGESAVSGTLSGLFAVRREVIDPAAIQLGRTAMGVVQSYNAQNREGVDLYGNLGGDIFANIDPAVRANSANTGTSTLTASINDLGSLTGRDILMSFDGVNWSARSAATGEAMSITGSGTPANPFIVEGVAIELGGGAAAAGDNFLLRPTADAARQVSVVMTDPNRIAAALPVRIEADLGNTGNGTLGPIQITNAADPNLQATVTIDFTAAGQYTVNGGGPFAYTSGQTIAVNGWQFTLSGEPAVGDEFVISAMPANSSDNGNARELAALDGANLFNNGTQSLMGSVSQMTSSIGSTARQASVALGAQGALDKQLQLERESVSGVNLDEEAANLLKFQQAYQAAAQIIAIASENFQTLLAAARS